MATTYYMKGVLELQEQLLVSGVKHEFQFLTNESLIPRARDQMAHQFLASDYAIHFWIDADIEFTVDDFGKVYQAAHAFPIAVAPYAMKKKEGVYAAWIKGKLVEDLSVYGALVDVDYAGTGFMAIRREAYKAIEMALPAGSRYENKDGEQVTAFYQTPIVDNVLLSEDYFFCKMARDAGLRITMDTTARPKHWGQAAYPIG